jgi:hypothetical protein
MLIEGGGAIFSPRTMGSERDGTALGRDSETAGEYRVHGGEKQGNCPRFRGDDNRGLARFPAFAGMTTGGVRVNAATSGHARPAPYRTTTLRTHVRPPA